MGPGCVSTRSAAVPLLCSLRRFWKRDSCQCRWRSDRIDYRVALGLERARVVLGDGSHSRLGSCTSYRTHSLAKRECARCWLRPVCKQRVKIAQICRLKMAHIRLEWPAVKVLGVWHRRRTEGAPNRPFDAHVVRHCGHASQAPLSPKGNRGQSAVS